MQVAVVGLGSMGKRRIRLLQKMDRDIGIWGVDTDESRCKETFDLYGVQISNRLEEVLTKEEIDVVFVCTSPVGHNAIIHTALVHNCHVFTEINLISDGYEENIKLAKKKGKKIFLSSTFLYRDEIKFIRNELSKYSGEVINYTYHVGQYLPDWHPWESYKDFFVGEKVTNACREIFAIDLPWMIKTFGEIKNVQVTKHKSTNLEIDYPDTYMVLLEHAGGNMGTFIVDVVSRKPVRSLEIYSERLYMSWDGTPNGLNRYNIEKKENENIQLYQEIDKRKEYCDFVVENEYMNEIENFFSVLEGEAEIYTMQDDIETLRWIDEIEK